MFVGLVILVVSFALITLCLIAALPFALIFRDTRILSRSIDWIGRIGEDEVVF